MSAWIFIVLAHWNNSPWVDMSFHPDTLSWFRLNQSLLLLLIASFLGQIKKYVCLRSHVKKIYGRSVGINFFFQSANLEIVVSGIRFRYIIFEISGKPSFVEAILWRVTQFFYLSCSQFRQKASGWINKTLLLIKQQKWLFKFSVKNW